MGRNPETPFFEETPPTSTVINTNIPLRMSVLPAQAKKKKQKKKKKKKN